jgi:hypothetical protein
MSLISLQVRVCDKCPKWQLLLLKNPPKLGLEKLSPRKRCESVPTNKNDNGSDDIIYSWSGGDDACICLSDKQGTLCLVYCTYTRMHTHHDPKIKSAPPPTLEQNSCTFTYQNILFPLHMPALFSFCLSI